MFRRIAADGSGNIPAYTCLDGAGGSPLVWADYDYGLAKAGCLSIEDAGDILDE